MTRYDPDRIGLSRTDCPTPALVQAAQSHVLPPDLQVSVSSHLENCPLCAGLVNDLAQLDSRPLSTATERWIWGRVCAGLRPATVPWWRSVFKPLPIYVTAAAAVLLLFGPRFVTTPRKPQTASRVAAAPRAATVFQLDKPAVVLPASAVLVWRGEGTPRDSQHRELQNALAPYRADNFVEAAKRLEATSAKYPHLAEARFYLGICRLYLRSPEAAARDLKAAQTMASSALRDRAEWYLALAYHDSGRKDEARVLLEELCRKSAPDSTRACSGLRELAAAR